MLTLDEVVPRRSLHVSPVLGVTGVREGHRDAQVVHDGARLARHDVVPAIGHLWHKPKRRRYGSRIAVKRVDATEENRVVYEERIVCGAGEALGVPVDVPAMPVRVVGAN